jgi:outer membrane protein assembly factor BamB
MTERKLVALSAADGQLAWETPYSVQGMGYNAATPMVDGQTLFYTGSGRGVKAVRIEKEGDHFTAKELWSNPDKSVQFNTPVLKDGFLYGLTAGNQLFCLNAQTGEATWSVPVAASSSAPPAPPAAPDGAGKAGAGGPGMGSTNATSAPGMGGPGGRGGGGPGGRGMGGRGAGFG